MYLLVWLDKGDVASAGKVDEMKRTVQLISRFLMAHVVLMSLCAFIRLLELPREIIAPLWMLQHPTTGLAFASRQLFGYRNLGT